MIMYVAVRLLEFHTGAIFLSFEEANRYTGNKLNTTKAFATLQDAERWLATRNNKTDEETIKKIKSSEYIITKTTSYVAK